MIICTSFILQIEETVMAEPRQARVLANLSDGAHGALLALQFESHPEISLQGGRYIIVNTGLENAEGKLIKRAYSIFAVKPEQQHFFLAAIVVKGGIASHYLASLKTDDVITFSGPWGRFHWPADALEKHVTMMAFGSGITGILGYLPTVPDNVHVELFWYKDLSGALLSDGIVQECAQRPHLQLHHRSMNDDPLVDLQKLEPKARFVAAGEGSRVDRCLQFLRDLGIADPQLQTDIFYRNQDLSDAKADR